MWSWSYQCGLIGSGNQHQRAIYPCIHQSPAKIAFILDQLSEEHLLAPRFVVVALLFSLDGHLQSELFLCCSIVFLVIRVMNTLNPLKDCFPKNYPNINKRLFIAIKKIIRKLRKSIILISNRLPTLWNPLARTRGVNVRPCSFSLHVGSESQMIPQTD